jgi:hypothetical protein
MSQEGRSVVREVILSKKVYTYMCPVPNGYRDRAISLYRRATRHVLTRVAKCIDLDGGIFENVLTLDKLYQLCHLNKILVLETVCNISFLSTILELYSGLALSRKSFGIGHMYIYSMLLRMTDTMTSQNTDLLSSNTLCMFIGITKKQSRWL